MKFKCLNNRNSRERKIQSGFVQSTQFVSSHTQFKGLTRGAYLSSESKYELSGRRLPHVVHEVVKILDDAVVVVQG